VRTALIELPLAALLGTYKGGGFQNRRDYAIISVFKDAGARPSKLFGLTTGDMTLDDADCAQAASLWGARGCTE
jgi:hypothetical protein